HEHRSEELVDAPAAELLPRGARLGLAAWRERHVDPAGEAVLQVPLRLAVAQEEQIRHGGAYSARLADAPTVTRVCVSRSRLIGSLSLPLESRPPHHGDPPLLQCALDPLAPLPV